MAEEENYLKPSYLFAILIIIALVLAIIAFIVCWVNFYDVHHIQSKFINTDAVGFRAVDNDILQRLINSKGEINVPVVNNLGTNMVRYNKTIAPLLINSPYLLFFTSSVDSYDNFTVLEQKANGFTVDVENKRIDRDVTTQIELKNGGTAPLAFEPTTAFHYYKGYPNVVAMVYDGDEVNSGPTEIVALVAPEKNKTGRDRWAQRKKLVSLTPLVSVDGFDPRLGAAYTFFWNSPDDVDGPASFFIDYGTGQLDFLRSDSGVTMQASVNFPTLGGRVKTPYMEFKRIGDYDIAILQNESLRNGGYLVPALRWFIMDAQSGTTATELVGELIECMNPYERKVFSTARLDNVSSMLMVTPSSGIAGMSLIPNFFTVNLDNTPSVTFASTTEYTMPEVKDTDQEYQSSIYQTQFISDDANGGADLVVVYRLVTGLTTTFDIVLYRLAKGTKKFTKIGYLYQTTGAYTKEFVIAYQEHAQGQRISIADRVTGINVLVDVAKPAAIPISFPPTYSGGSSEQSSTTKNIGVFSYTINNDSVCVIATQSQLFVSDTNTISWVLANTNTTNNLVVS